MFSNILIPLDMSNNAEKAIPHAVAIASKYGSSLTFTTIIAETTLANSTQIAIVEAYLKAWCAELDETVFSVNHIIKKNNDAANEILAIVVDKAFDLIVMTSHGAQNGRKWRIGRNAEQVVSYSPIPVCLIYTANEDSLVTKPFIPPEEVGNV